MPSTRGDNDNNDALRNEAVADILCCFPTALLEDTVGYVLGVRIYVGSRQATGAITLTTRSAVMLVRELATKLENEQRQGRELQLFTNKDNGCNIFRVVFVSTATLGKVQPVATSTQEPVKRKQRLVVTI